MWVGKGKLRELIRDREAGKICRQESAAKDSVIDAQAAQLANSQQQLTVSHSRDSMCRVLTSIRDIQLDNMIRQRDDTQAYLAQAEKQYKRQVWRTWEVGGIGIVVTGGLFCALIKK